MEVQILHYYLKSLTRYLLILFIIFTLFFLYFININKQTSKNIIFIQKGEEIEKVIKKGFNNLSFFDILIFKFYYRIFQFNNNGIHYGEFYINNEINFYNFLNIIGKPSNILNKITIVEGWSKNQLNNELSKYFSDIFDINYTDILADTYYFQKNEKFINFANRLKNFKNNVINKNIKNKFFKNFNEEDLFIIGSLIEKEGKDDLDKKKIYSVIKNRIKINMKLQIDATVLYALTNGDFDLKRKITYKDLKINHPYNTYINKGLPPRPISYVGTKTIDLIMKDYNTNYLFYFYNDNLSKHVFSENFNDHKKKLNEFRKTK